MEHLAAGDICGRLTLIRRVKVGYRGAWECRCECGTLVTVREDGLQSGHVKSCGCLRNELARARLMTHGEAGTGKRGGWPSGTYSSWRNMKARCLNPNATGYENYGGRGVTVCARWLESFKNFLADMGPRPKGQTIDRLNVEGAYEPSNCRWATRRQQQETRGRQGRGGARWTLDGKRITVAEIAHHLAMSSRAEFYYLRYHYYTKTGVKPGPRPKN